MGLSAPKPVYGIHSLTLYDRANWMPFGIIKVLGDLAFDLSGDFNDLYGGSFKFPWASESGVLSAGLEGTIKEIPNFAFEKFLGASTTANAAESSGNVGTLTNQEGATCVAATGIATATALSGSEADLKDGLYVVKVVGSSPSVTVDVYCMSDVDFDKGTDKVFEDDELKITATPLTITLGGDTTVPGYGFKLTGGGSAIAMDEDDTAYVYIRKINSGSDLITIGQSNPTFPAFGCFVNSQKTSEGHNFEIQMFNCSAIGLPIPLTEADWMNADINIRAIYDANENAVAKYRRILG